MMFNKIIMIGNLTRDVEKRYLPSGAAIATLGLASNRRFTKQDGTKGDETCFIDVKLFGRTAEVAEQYLRKGSKVLIEGRLVYETWMDQSGQKRSKHAIVSESMQMLDSKSQDSNRVEYNESGNYGQANDRYDHMPHDNGYKQNMSPSKESSSQGVQNIPSIDIDDDEIPF